MSLCSHGIKCFKYIQAEVLWLTVRRQFLWFKKAPDCREVKPRSLEVFHRKHQNLQSISAHKDESHMTKCLYVYTYTMYICIKICIYNIYAHCISIYPYIHISIYPYTRFYQKFLQFPTTTKKLVEKEHPLSPNSNRSSTCLLSFFLTWIVFCTQA